MFMVSFLVEFLLSSGVFKDVSFQSEPWEK